MNFRYVVIVCPKCRQNAQITDIRKKSLRCQRCGIILQARKLKVFHSSEELDEAIAFRTRLQAEISRKESEFFLLRPFTKEYKISKPETKNKAKAVKISGNMDSGSIFPKKDPKAIFLELLEDAGGKIEIEKLQQKALEKEVSPEKFNIILRTLLEAGEIYSPESGIIKLL
jgi:DNA replicative helicase MCM subunit Mcm2 (Cdc46/Mcm family)